MSETAPPPSHDKNTIIVTIEDEMRGAYLDYAMSVIVGRALPDVRDGLKPVHRRVLYAMYDLGNTYNKAYKKLSCKRHRVDWEELNEVVERVRKKPGAIKGGDDHGDALNLD